MPARLVWPLQEDHHARIHLCAASASPLSWYRQVAAPTAGQLYSLTVTQDVASIARRPHGGLGAEERSMGRVQDRVAVVTGGANGLGQAIACRLAEEGARLVLGDLDAGGLERTVAHITNAGGAALSVVGDLTEEESRRRGSSRAPSSATGGSICWSTWSGAAARGKSGQWRSRTGTLSCVSTSAVPSSARATRSHT